jgi:hypothetical protein
MAKLTKIIGLSTFIIIIVLIKGYFFPEPLSINPEKVKKIEIYEVKRSINNRPVDDSNRKVYVIENKDELFEISEIFQRVRIPEENVTAKCPFSMEAIFYEGKKKLKVSFGTDSCGVLEYKDNYYYVFDEYYKKYQKLIEIAFAEFGK